MIFLNNGTKDVITELIWALARGVTGPWAVRSLTWSLGKVWWEKGLKAEKCFYFLFQMPCLLLRDFQTDLQRYSLLKNSVTTKGHQIFFWVETNMHI